MITPLYSNYDLLEIARRALDSIHFTGELLLWIAVPLALIPPVPLRWGWIWTRVFVITVVVWCLILGYHTEYYVPWNRIVLDIEQRDPTYDGVGATAAWLIAGWTVPFIQSLATLGFARFILLQIAKLRKSQKESSESENQIPVTKFSDTR